MRLIAARSEVAAPDALPRGFHSPPLAWTAFSALVSSLLLFVVYYITFLKVVNAKIHEKEARSSIRASFMLLLGQ